MVIGEIKRRVISTSIRKWLDHDNGFLLGDCIEDYCNTSFSVSKWAYSEEVHLTIYRQLGELRQANARTWLSQIENVDRKD